MSHVPEDADPAEEAPQGAPDPEVVSSETDGETDAPDDHETGEDVRQEALLLEKALGGWRGVIDSGLPTVVFITAYLVTGNDLGVSLICAIAAGVIVVAWRLVRRQPLQQVLAGFIGLLIAAWFSSRTGRAEDVFLPGLLLNIAYGAAFLISILVRWPLLGIAMGYLTGEGTSWRRDVELRRVYAAASWIWVGVFTLRIAVQVPLYLAGAVAPLGVVKIVLGWPLYLAGAYVTYRLLAPVYRARRAQR
jgi:Protein of unknown function (DUF3159)